MRLSVISLLAFIVSSSAIPGPIPGIFVPMKPPAFYTRLLYPFLFRNSDYVGAFLGPVLKLTLGDNILEFLDKTADRLCISAGNDGGVCQEALEALYQLGIAYTPAGQSTKFRKLIAVLCIAPDTQPPIGTCQALLETCDCVANRLLQVKDVECTNNTKE
ncbi:hypothetical protein BDZ94DRAFT_1008436 [Collybia nuda]|uniref:Secreted protein n=1 Tax=Collybia nuda TaxID=64659 RepID=A0A9P6CG16_9AGAR|nr:hypothetical protein BDZ94DRAFT_1008436 [Collybia nuda]